MSTASNVLAGVTILGVLGVSAALTLGGDRAVFNARVDSRSRARPGEAFRLAVDPAHFHYFDPKTGVNLGLASAPAEATAEATAT